MSSETDLSDARTDAKFERVLGEMRTEFTKFDGRLVSFNQRLDHIETTTNARFDHMESSTNLRFDHIENSISGIKATVIGTGIAAVAIVIGIMTYGQTWFGLGLSQRDIIKATVQEYVAQVPPKP